VVQEPTRVYEIEFSLGQLFGRYVVGSSFEVVLVDFLKKSDVNIGGRDVAFRSRLAAEPPCDRPSSAAHLKTPPPLAHTQRHQPPLGQRVQMLLEEGEPAPSSLPGIF
jgi:hypothetical protein